MADSENPNANMKYDNAAFGYFMLTALFMYIVPSGIYTARRLWKVAFGSKADVGTVRCSSSLSPCRVFHCPGV